MWHSGSTSTSSGGDSSLSDNGRAVSFSIDTEKLTFLYSNNTSVGRIEPLPSCAPPTDSGRSIVCA